MEMNEDKVIKINGVANRCQEKQQQSKTESIKVHKKTIPTGPDLAKRSVCVEKGSRQNAKVCVRKY